MTSRMRSRPDHVPLVHVVEADAAGAVLDRQTLQMDEASRISKALYPPRGAPGRRRSATAHDHDRVGRRAALACADDNRHLGPIGEGDHVAGLGGGERGGELGSRGDRHRAQRIGDPREEPGASCGSACAARPPGHPDRWRAA